MLEYELKSFAGPIPLDQITGVPIHVEIWIDPNNNFISRTVVSQKNKESRSDLKIIQTFSGYNFEFKIEEPTDLLLKEKNPPENEIPI